MNYPIFVYKSPGPFGGLLGGSYQYRSVADAAEHDAALADGWHATADDAIVAAGKEAFTHGVNKRQLARVLKNKPWERLPKPAKPAEVVPVVEPVAQAPADDAPPTRAEIEEQATLLGIKFDGRTSDKRLLDRIAEAMKGA